ncbi:MAG: N-acetylmuramic acid 6-phosphate etherase [Saprospiraceae bacterium]|nr:N-acetylmuramic acid 6-phosphate etherase [Saprospiraceae bacterium]
MKKITESASPYRHLEQMPVRQLLQIINQEDQRVPLAVAKAIPAIEACVSQVSAQMQQGGRLFYIGAGTSGRLGILDASECPPTFGVPDDWVIGLIAGGDTAIRSAVEFAEDDANLAWEDLQQHNLHSLDFVIGIAASGTTPYVVHGLEKCQENGIRTAAIFCNPNAPISQFADYPIEVIVGPEVVTGSTRMKAGTAQKLVLNMISTSVMIQLGRVVDNRMVDMQLSNQKLLERGTLMLMESLQIDQQQARRLLQQHGSVRKAIAAFRNG